MSYFSCCLKSSHCSTADAAPQKASALRGKKRWLRGNGQTWESMVNYMNLHDFSGFNNKTWGFNGMFMGIQRDI